MSARLRRLKHWSAAIFAGFVVTMIADDALDSLGHEPTMAGGLSVGAGVAAAALTGQWLERRHQARERLAQLEDVDEE